MKNLSVMIAAWTFSIGMAQAFDLKYSCVPDQPQTKNARAILSIETKNRNKNQITLNMQPDADTRALPSQDYKVLQTTLAHGKMTVHGSNTESILDIEFREFNVYNFPNKLEKTQAYATITSLIEPQKKQRNNPVSLNLLCDLVLK